ncbi:unnamed protein product [Heterobilharzia americana]|nr:unnamed protein product [Heterobilharzia americana]
MMINHEVFNHSTSPIASSFYQEVLNTDPNLTFDDLPMPYKKLDQLLWSIFDTTWNIIEAREKYKNTKFILHQSSIQNVKINLNIENVHLYTLIGQYLFKTYENQVTVYNIHNLQSVSKWIYKDNFFGGNISIRALQIFQLNKDNILFTVLINNMGQTAMLMFVEGMFIPVKLVNLMSDNQAYHALNGKISPCGQFYISLNKDSINSQVWLEIYRLPVDIWMKEISPLIQEFQNTRINPTNDDKVPSVQEIVDSLHERKTFYENEFQLSSPLLLGRIRYPNIQPIPAYKSVTAALKHVNEKANLVNFSNIGTHLYSDIISEVNQLAFIQHRNYSSCLMSTAKFQQDGENRDSVQELMMNSPEYEKQEVSESVTGRTKSNTPILAQHTGRHSKSSKRKLASKDNSTLTGNRKKKGDKNHYTAEVTETLINKENESKKQFIEELNTEAVGKRSTLDEYELSDELLDRSQMIKTIREQLIKDLNEAQPKSYPYFEFLPIYLNSDVKYQETSTSNIVGYSRSLCVYWSESSYLYFYSLDKFTKSGECVPEEVRYVGSYITHMSVVRSSYPVNTNQSYANKKQQQSQGSDPVNSCNDYLLIGLQSGLVIVQQLQSGRYLPLLHTGLGPIADASLTINGDQISLVTACLLNEKTERSSSEGNNLSLSNNFTFDVYNLDRQNKISWERQYITKKNKLCCHAITILTSDDSYSIIVCLISVRDMLIFPFSIQHLKQENMNHSTNDHICRNQQNSDLYTDSNRFWQNVIQISLPNPYEVNLCSGTISLFSERNEQWINNTELFHQLYLVSYGSESNTEDYNDDNDRNHDDNQELEKQNTKYYLWIRGTKYDPTNEDTLQSKLFYTCLQFEPVETVTDSVMSITRIKMKNHI